MNVTISRQLALPGKRFLAFFLDYLLIAAYIIILAVVGFSLTFIVGPLPIASPWIMDLIAFLTAVLPVMLYFTLLEGGSAQATWGKRWVGIQVTAVNSQPITYGRVFVRSFIKFAPWQLAHTSLFHIPGWPFAIESVGDASMIGLVVAQGLVLLYILSLLFTSARRTPYDWAAGTVVIGSKTVHAAKENNNG